MIKRALDLIAATLGLVLMSPVMAVIAILVKRESDGPVIFRQQRVGRKGRLFMLFKFRSMRMATVHVEPLITVSKDTRITKVGASLRSTKLDELPQLINVLRGEMSIVGPRPEVPRYVEMWPDEDRRIILSVRPGITDPATVRLRREEELLLDQPNPEAFYRNELLPQKVDLYRQYVETQSLRTDFGLLVKTLLSVLTR